MAVMRPCIECGTVALATRCEDCEVEQQQRREEHRGSARQRGYDSPWDRLSRKARRLQPFCTDCGSTVDLTCDHLPSAWERKAQGKPLRLADVDVLCGPCNKARGSSRRGTQRALAQTRGGPPSDTPPGPPPEAKFGSHSASEVVGEPVALAAIELGRDGVHDAEFDSRPPARRVDGAGSVISGDGDDPAVSVADAGDVVGGPVVAVDCGSHGPDGTR